MTAGPDEPTFEPAAPAIPPEPVSGFVLHNRRPRRWPGWVALIAGGLFIPVLCGLQPLLAVAAFLLLVGANWAVGTRTVGLADLLSIWPANRHFAPQAVAAFEVGQDPLEDYADEGETLCELSIILPRGPRVRILLTAEEASRALRWAASKGVPTRMTHDVRRGDNE